METQKSITAWAEETFGHHTALAKLVRCNVEIAELLSALSSGAVTEIGGELADVKIIFMQVKEALGDDTTYVRSHGCSFTLMRLASELSQQVGLLMMMLEAGIDGEPMQLSLYVVEDIIHDMAYVLQVDLNELVDEKMKVNRARQWGRTSAGRHQHISEAA